MTDAIRGRKKFLRWFMLAPLCGMLAACAGIERLALPRADLVDSHWRDHGERAGAVVDHAPWDRFLARHVRTGPDGVNRVSYAAVRADERAALDTYLTALSATRVSRLGRDAQRAFWINLYNALTVRLVLAHYPVKSIRKIKPHFYSLAGPWGMPLITIEGRRLSLNDIEHRVLRPLWPDPRLHYALNCAATGCPNLQKRAFTGANTEALLEAGARAYINSPRGVAIDDRGRVTVSRIYVWFREDFGGGATGVLAHLRRYAAPELKARLAGATRIHKYRYDWSLNEDRGE